MKFNLIGNFLVGAGLFLAAVPAMATDAPAHSTTPQLFSAMPRLGQFDHLLIGLFNPVPEDEVSQQVFWGLPYSYSAMAAVVRDASNKYYYIQFGIFGDGASGKLVGDASINMASPKGMMPDPRANHDAKCWGVGSSCSIWHGPVQQSVVPSEGLRFSSPEFEVTVNGQNTTWTSKSGTVSIKGTLAAPGIHYWLPWENSDGKTDAMHYTGQYYKIEGTLFGEPIKGVLAWEQNFGSTPFGPEYLRRIGNWVAWTTEYDDGVTEAGYFLCGEGAVRGGVVGNGKGQEVLNTSKVNATAKFRADGSPEQIQYTADGQRWNFDSYPESTEIWPEEGKPSIVAISGEVKRAGEKRKVVRAFAQTFTIGGKMCSHR